MEKCYQARPLCPGGSGSGRCALRILFISVTHSVRPQVAARAPSLLFDAVNHFPQITHGRSRSRLPEASAPDLPPALGLHLTSQMRHGLPWLNPP